MTTYFSWRYVFVGEVVILVFVVLFARRIAEKAERQSIRIDVLSVVLSAFGLVGVVFGMLQSKTWGWIVPLNSPEINGVEIAPLGISLTAWFIVVGVVLLVLFFARQRSLVAQGRDPLLHADLLSITAAAQRTERPRRPVRDHRGTVLHGPRLPADDPGLRRARDRLADLPAVDLAHPLLDLRHPAVDAVVAAPRSCAWASGSSSRARSCC